MKTGLLQALAAIVVALLLSASVSADGKSPAPSAQVVILKLDDVTTNGARDGLPVSPRWQRVTDFIERNNLKGSFGIIGYSLEEDNEAYFDWIRDVNEKGFIEFWNHGYRNRTAKDKAGEFEGSYDEQKAALERTQKLAKEKLGIELTAFGPHWSGTNEDTARALATIPGIRIWFYGHPADAKPLVFKRVLTLESPTFVPDFAKFKARYQQVARDEPCLALQGHPNAWNDERWAGFVKIIEYLQAQGCVFMTPSEYLETVSAY